MSIHFSGGWSEVRLSAITLLLILICADFSRTVYVQYRGTHDGKHFVSTAWWLDARAQNVSGFVTPLEFKKYINWLKKNINLMNDWKILSWSFSKGGGSWIFWLTYLAIFEQKVLCLNLFLSEGPFLILQNHLGASEDMISMTRSCTEAITGNTMRLCYFSL